MSNVMDGPHQLGPDEPASARRRIGSSVYDLLARGDIVSVKTGRKRLVSGRSIAGDLNGLAAGTAR
jgi:hypothetical protein